MSQGSVAMGVRFCYSVTECYFHLFLVGCETFRAHANPVSAPSSPHTSGSSGLPPLVCWSGFKHIADIVSFAPKCVSVHL